MTNQEALEKYGDEYDKVFNNVDTAKCRVENELVDLKIKIEKLANTLNANGYGNLAIPKEQVTLLNSQYMSMKVYESFLQMRLDVWKD